MNNIRKSFLLYMVFVVNCLTYCQETVQHSSGLSFVSDPEGAKVYVNDKYIGITPCIIEKINSGNYNVIFEKEGFNKDTLNQLLSDDVHMRIFIQLEKNKLMNSNKYGSLRIISDPDNAEILLDGRSLGITPFISDSIKEGNYKILITKQDYFPFERTIVVENDQNKVLNIALTSEESVRLAKDKKHKKNKKIRRIIFGSISATFLASGIIAHNKLNSSLKSEEAALNDYNEFGLEQDEYDKLYENYEQYLNNTNSLIKRRKIYYSICGIAGAGFIVSIPF